MTSNIDNKKERWNHGSRGFIFWEIMSNGTIEIDYWICLKIHALEPFSKMVILEMITNRKTERENHNDLFICCYIELWGSNQDWDMNYKICGNEINNKTEWKINQ